MRLFIASLTRTARQLGREAVRRPASAVWWLGQIALGLGTVTALGALLFGLVVKPLALPALDELVVLHEHDEKGGTHPLIVSDGDFEQGWRSIGEPFDAAAAYAAFDDDLIVHDGSTPFLGCATAGPFFRTVRSRFVLGRPFSSDELKDEARVAIVSRAFWVRHLGERPEVLGTTISTARGTYQIVGVVSDDSVYPPKTEVWTPRERYRGPGRFYVLTVIGRLKQGWTPSAAAETLEHRRPIDHAGGRLALVPLADHALGDSRVQATGSAVLLAVAVAALGVNLVHMGVARGIARRRRTYIVLCLGGTRTDVFLGALFEQSLIWLCGAALAPLVSHALLKAILPGTPLAGLLTPDVLLWRAASWQMAAIPCIAPLMALAQFSAEAPGAGSSAHAAAGGYRRRWFASVALSQAMCATSLLVVTAAVVKGGLNVQASSTGVKEDGLTTFRVVLPTRVYAGPADRLRFCRLVLAQLHQLPGVVGAEAGVVPLLTAVANLDPKLDEELERPHQRFVTPGYLATVGTHVRAGRLFDPLDSADGVAVVNEEYVRRFGGSGEVVGKRIEAAGRRQIIGVVSNIRDVDLWVRPRPLVYVPFDGKFAGAQTFVIRSATGGKAVSYREIQAAVSKVDGSVAVRELERLEDRIRRARVPWRSKTFLAACAAVVGLCLLLSGLHGLVSFVMLQERRNVAIRMAVGADSTSLVTVFGRQLVAPVGYGGFLGIVLGALGLGVLRWQLYGVGTEFVALCLLLALLVPGVAVVLSLRAARHAVREDLTMLLRAE